MILVPAIIDIVAVIAMQSNSMPGRFIIYGLWIGLVPFMLSIVARLIMEDIDEFYNNSSCWAIGIGIFMLFCALPIYMALCFFNKPSFIIWPPKYRFGLVEGSNVEDWLDIYYHGFPPLRPVIGIGKGYVFIFRDKDMVAMKLGGLLGERM